MRDFAFYNAGCEPARGARRGMVLARRVLRRILRPMFFHLERVAQSLQHQIDGLCERGSADLQRHQRQMDDLQDQVSSASALGWDHVAMARRLALLEDQVERLHRKLGTADQPQEWGVSIPLRRFPEEEGHDLPERRAAEG
jgi:hypothetical protein